MKKRLKENSLLGAFQLEGTPTEQENLNKLLEEVLNTKSGRQLVEDIRSIDSKPIPLSFVSKEQVREGVQGEANAETGAIVLTPIESNQYLRKVSVLAHELHHQKIAKFFLPFYRSSIAQQIYAHITNEASTFAFEACVFDKELSEIHPEFKSKCEFSQKEFIERWMHGGINRFAQNYINGFARRFNPWLPAMDEREFMTQMAKFQQREIALPMESLPWYKASKSGGCYIIGTEAFLEMDERGAPICRCICEGDRKFKSIVYSREQKKTKENAFIPSQDLYTIAKRPILPSECALVQDYFEGKISKDKLPEIENMSLPKGIGDNMTDIVDWRESFIPTKTPHKAKTTKPSKDPKTYE